VKDLLKSGILENQELALTFLGSETITKEEKIEYVDKFISDYTSGNVNFFLDEHKYIFEKWVELYRTVEKDQIYNRVKQIE
jgi:hypothetical protein